MNDEIIKDLLIDVEDDRRSVDGAIKELEEARVWLDKMVLNYTKSVERVFQEYEKRN